MPDWAREGADWPHRMASRFVTAAGLRWHVQVMGQGRDLLLLHGTGASTHSWRDLMPLLAATHRVTAIDLPGHGFTTALPRHRCTLPGMAAAVASLLTVLATAPTCLVGHSAGAAIAARGCLDGLWAPACLIALNGAILPLGGAGSSLFSPIARFLVGVPAVPWLFARRAGSDRVVRQLLTSTGSRLSDEGVAFYARLMRSPAHVAGALGMMAGWNLAPLARDLPALRTRLVLVVGGNDRTVPPADSERVHAMVPGARLVRLPGLGHLAHEERPYEVAKIILNACAENADVEDARGEIGSAEAGGTEHGRVEAGRL